MLTATLTATTSMMWTVMVTLLMATTVTMVTTTMKTTTTQTARLVLVPVLRQVVSVAAAPTVVSRVM